MALLFYPRAGQIFVCDFTSFKQPEMTKLRPVIVISPRLPYRSELATIVPISTTPPRHDLPFVVKLSKNYHPDATEQISTWAKCDMVTVISTERLTAFKVGRRKYAYPTLTPEDLSAVRTGVVHGLGLTDLIK